METRREDITGMLDTGDRDRILAALRANLLKAREERQELIAKLCAGLPLPSAGGDAAGDLPSTWVLIVAGTNVPGAAKEPGGLEAAFEGALKLLERDPEVVRAARDLGFAPRLCGGHDALGPYEAWSVPGDPAAIKKALVRIEESAPWARLLDLDLYTADGAPVGRAALGLPPRRCLVCDEPALECIRAARHAPMELRARVRELIGTFIP